MGNGMEKPFQYGILLLSPAALKAQTWTHVAVAVDTPAGASEPFGAYLYINGVQVDSEMWSEGARQWAPDSPLRISRYDNVDPDVQYWDGKLDELRVWNSVRTAEQILANMFLSLSNIDGLVLYYKFDVDVRDDQNAVIDSSNNSFTAYVQHDGPVSPTYW